MSARDEIASAATKNGWTEKPDGDWHTEYRRGSRHVAVQYSQRGSVEKVSTSRWALVSEPDKRQRAIDELKR